MSLATKETMEKDPAVSSLHEGSVEPEWAPKDVKSVMRKLDFFLMPMLVAGFFVLQLDRSNISNALTDTITKDLGITTDNVNLGNQLMIIGIVVAEIPSNFMLQKLGASIWLTFQMFVWGTIALTQSWCTNIHSFYATRFLLGLFEGGYIPGAQYMLALFYVREEMARRTTIFYFGNYLSTAVGSLLAAGILQMAGTNGLSGWQWLFIIEGIMTLVVFVLFTLFLPRSPSHTAPIHGRWDFFSDHDRAILRSRVLAEDKSKGEDKAGVSLKNLGKAALNHRLWLHCALNVLSLAPKGGLQLYGPYVIKSLGFSKVNANLLSAVSSMLVVILSYFISLGSDLTKLRGPWCIVGFIWSIAFAAGLYGMPVGEGKWPRYAVFTLLSGCNALAQGLNDAWVNINARTSSERSFGLAMVVIGSNLGGIAGGQLFRSSDAPRYTHSWLAILLLYIACIPVTLLIMWIYWRDNKKLARESEVDSSGMEHRPRKKYDI